MDILGAGVVPIFIGPIDGTGGEPVVLDIQLAAPAPSGGMTLYISYTQLQGADPFVTSPPTVDVPPGEAGVARVLLTNPLTTPSVVLVTVSNAANEYASVEAHISP